MSQHSLWFACGDGQCVDAFSKCANKREKFRWLNESILQGNLSYDCWKSMICLSGYFIDEDTHECGYFCWGECASRIVKECPQYILFPDHAVVSDNVYLIYTKDAVNIELDLIGDPTFLCFDIDKCTNDLQPFVNVLNQRCIYFHRLNITLNPVNTWAKRMTIIAQIFNSLWQRNSTSFSCPTEAFYQCAHTKKCISNRRLVDGIIDCVEGDDETFAESCSLIDATERFRCPDEKKCISLRMINDGYVDCKRRDDELHPHKRLGQSRVMFPTICDGFQDLQPILIDGRNETDETDCEKWLCDNVYTRCNGIWNCKNGIDEIGCRKYTFECPP